MTEPQPAAHVTSIGQIALTVRDVDRAVAFYRDVVGLRFLFRTGELAFFDCGGVRLMLSRPEKAEFDHPASILYYKVADIAAATATLEARGAVVEQRPVLVAKLPDHDLWMSFFRDPESNVFALMSEVRRG